MVRVDCEQLAFGFRAGKDNLPQIIVLDVLRMVASEALHAIRMRAVNGRLGHSRYKGVHCFTLHLVAI